jgi:PadR family transcriptional regulator PadR
MFKKELNGACSTMILLGVLAQEESYGYAIIQSLKQHSGGKLEWAEGMLYPLLRRLEKSQLLTSRWVSPETGRRRRYYTVTQKGMEALAAEKKQWQEANTLLESLWNLNPKHA